MLSPHVIGIIYALISAVVWGTGDFSGGVATRTHSQFQVLAIMSVPGIVIIALIAFIIGETTVPIKDILWATSAGISGALGIAALYRGLSMGNAASVAPTAAVIGAALPAGFGCLFIGMPEAAQIAGFIIAILGIWFVSRPPDSHARANNTGLLLAILAGSGFGVFFILIGQVEHGRVFAPLVIAKITALILALVILKARREGIPSLGSNPIALLAGLFDAGGNVFYMLAKQYTRIDVAAVLASMYPSVTVILASIILHEKVSASQWRGVALCVAAIALIGL